MEHANNIIIFNDNGLIDVSAPTANDYDDIFPYCVFQYTASTNNEYNISESLTHYAITFVGNRPPRNSLYTY